MKRSSENFINTANKEWEDLGGGVSRQFLGWNNQIMMVKVKFEKGAEGALHQHFHAQTAYCASGRFEFNIEGEKKVIESGDGVFVEPNLMHGVVCLEPGVLVDVFSPVREDFLKDSDFSY